MSGPVSVCRACLVRCSQSLALVELTRPDHRAGERDQRGCDHGLGAPAVPLGECDRLAAAPLGRGERANPRRETELRQAADLEVGPADLPGQGSALPQVTFGVRQRQRPRLGGAQVHQRHRPQVAAQRDVLVGLPGDRRVEESGLFDERRPGDRAAWPATASAPQPPPAGGAGDPAAPSRRAPGRPPGGRPPRPGAPGRGHPSRAPGPARGDLRPPGRPAAAPASSAPARRGSG